MRNLVLLAALLGGGYYFYRQYFADKAAEAPTPNLPPPPPIPKAPITLDDFLWSGFVDSLINAPGAMVPGEKKSEVGSGVMAPPTSNLNDWTPPPSAAPYLDALRNAERFHFMPKNLLARVAYQESRFRPDIINGETISSAGAQGLMQIVPRWHVGVNPLDPFESIDYAAGYLAQLKRRFGSWDKALAAYNWGPTNLSRAIDKNGENWLAAAPTETRNYVKQISADVLV